MYFAIPTSPEAQSPYFADPDGARVALIVDPLEKMYGTTVR